MNYNIIKDEKTLLDFIEWLPKLKSNEQYYISLLARRKYDKSGIIKTEKAVLSRATATKDWLYQKIKKMEIEMGSYTIGEYSIPEESMALYIHPNPRCMKKATFETSKQLLVNIENSNFLNPKTVAFNAIQNSIGRTIYMDFDFDVEKNDQNLEELINKTYEIVGDSFTIIETRGGYHVLVNVSYLNSKYYKLWFNDMVIITIGGIKADRTKDLLLPVVGCVQGDFVPTFKIKYK